MIDVGKHCGDAVSRVRRATIATAGCGLNGAAPRSYTAAPGWPRRGGLRMGLACVAILAALAPALASACARDGVPSVSLNGRLAVLNRTSQRVVLTTWSPFIFARPAQRGHAVTLAEDNREVARALPHEVFGHPWRWDFGDHSTFAYGTHVHHTYKQAGTYRIAVLAYYPVYAAWQPFDYVTIHVR